MFVCDLDRPWIDSPFLLQGFLLETAKDIETVQKVCDYVYVDVAKCIRKERKRPPKAQGRRTDAPLKIGFAQAFEHSIDIYDRAHALVKSTMDDIQFGKAIDTGSAKSLVKECVDTIIANPNTLLLLTRIRNKDEYTSQHSLNVCILSIVLGRFLGIPVAKLEELGLCGLLHDMGKIKVPNEILNKEGRLTPEEYEIMKSHATLGRDILMTARDIPPSAVDVAYSHHEKLNGSGYPRGRNSESITPFTKIVSIVDTYDAITSDRVYQNGRSHLNALNILMKSSGTHFPSSLVINFIACIGVYPPGSIVEFENGEVGIVFEVSAEAKSKPKVLLTLDRFKMPREEIVLDLSQESRDENGEPYRIKEVLRPKSYDIDLKTYLKEVWV
ncbi:MAG: HD-GYP domain-containing protein [Methylococcaceae bacterium]|nr:HD-GYP domain-containing protein [Methylococcaceae bacterium]